MAEEVVVKEVLSPERIKAGQELIARLGSSGLSVEASFWLYSSETNRWTLVIASPLVTNHGPRKAVEILLRALDTMPQEMARVLGNDLTVMEHNKPLVVGFYRMREQGLMGKGQWSGHAVINGEYVEDAYVY
ncbi:MAG: hypothetical protein HY532_01460 [Chloroflexi bacterium]|nr:hypothetical protein [Chloroflexota bacterium]